MKKIIGFMTIILALSLGGCSNNTTVEPKQKSNLTVGMIKSKVIKGQTTQDEIMRIFGAPNMVTKNRDNDEVWSYNKMSVDAAEQKKHASLFIIGESSATESKTTSSFDWIITFDENDVVKDYSLISSSY
jgi:hypothetical protein